MVGSGRQNSQRFEMLISRPSERGAAVFQATQVIDRLQRHGLPCGDNRRAGRIGRDRLAGHPTHRIAKRHCTFLRILGGSGNDGHGRNGRRQRERSRRPRVTGAVYPREAGEQPLEIALRRPGHQEKQQVSQRCHFWIDPLAIELPLDVKAGQAGAGYIHRDARQVQMVKPRRGHPFTPEAGNSREIASDRSGSVPHARRFGSRSLLPLLQAAGRQAQETRGWGSEPRC